MIEAAPNEQETQKQTSETGTSLIGTSDPLLTNPSLTDVFSTFPIWPELDQPKTHNPQATIPVGSRNLATSSIGAPGTYLLPKENVNPGDDPQQALPPVRTNQCKVVTEVCVKEDVPEVVHLRGLLFLPNELHHQQLLPRSPTLALM